MCQPVKNEPCDDLAPTILVGTFREVNSEWIVQNKLYNLPLPKGYHCDQYKRFTHIVLWDNREEPISYTAKFSSVEDRKWLRDRGYATSSSPHGDEYVIFALGRKVSHEKILSDPTADVFVCSSRFTGRIDKDFYTRPLPKCGGRSIPNIFEKLRPFVEKWRSAYSFDPVQTDFLQTIIPARDFPVVRGVEYADGVIRVHDGQAEAAPPTFNCAPFRLGEFFCGPGGLACGAMSAQIENPNFRIEHAWSNDYDQETCNTYAENICNGHPETVICHDVRKLRLDDPRLTPIDGFAFGFPCNDFSVVGEHKGIDGSYGPLYQYGVAVLRRFRPMWFVAENVGGLASANEGAAFKKILGSMKDAGYRIYPHLYKFEDYGVPQTRHRIIIIGIREDLPYVFYPPSPMALQERDNSSRAALEEPPIPQDAPNNELTAQNPRVVERLQYILPGQNAFTANLPEHLRLNVRGAKISQIYKRLNPDKPAYTVTGSGGGGTHIYHYHEPRALTNRERARLQTFPDAFLFAGSKESVRKQIGMAVPPRGARIIFEALLRTLAGIDYEHIECNISDDGELKNRKESAK